MTETTVNITTNGIVEIFFSLILENKRATKNPSVPNAALINNKNNNPQNLENPKFSLLP